MGKYKTIIHVEGRNIEDLFRLPCVEGIVKCSFPNTLGPFTIILSDFHTTAYVGDYLCEDYEGNWTAIKSDELNED